MKTIVLISLLFFSINSFAQCEKVIENAFAHNDYEHKKPLFDALFYGFTYVEADIHSENKKLRFWGTPNTIETIKLLIKEKVDLIGTDELNVFTELKSQPIKIMSFNIRYNNPNDGKNRWELRKELVIQNIKEYNSDFVGLQEVTYSQFQYVNSGLSDNYSVIGRCRGVLPTQGEASPIYYKKADWLLLTSGNFWLSKMSSVR